MVFYAGQWRTPAGVEHRKAWKRKRHAERILTDHEYAERKRAHGRKTDKVRSGSPERRRKSQAYYYKTGYAKRRLRDLAEQKATTLNQLADVREQMEAILSESQR